jgi:peroxin-16
VEEFLLSKALTTSAVKPATALVRALFNPQDWLSEFIYVLRPLVHVSLLAFDRMSDRPLLVLLTMDLLSRNLRRTPPPSASLERSEYARRDRDLLRYFLRGSIWTSFTRPKLEAFASKAQSPLLGLLGSLVKDWMLLIDEYYYYTAP